MTPLGDLLQCEAHRTSRWRWTEALPWVAFILFYFLFESQLALGNTVLVMVLFTLSLDLIMGYAGIATLGHALFFGVGAYAAGIMVANGLADPVAGLVAGTLLAALVAALTGSLLLHLKGNTLLMLTLAFLMLVHEGANKWTRVTGGDDGLHSLVPGALFGWISFDLRGHTRYGYALIVLMVMFIVARYIVHSQFGLALRGIRENAHRMHAMGVPVRHRLIVIYTIAGSMAGTAGVVSAHSNAFVGLDSLTIALSANCLVMLVLGGWGRLYGAIVGATVYVLLHHFASNWNPYHWMFLVGASLIIVVRFGKGGLLGLYDRLVAGRTGTKR